MSCTGYGVIERTGGVQLVNQPEALLPKRQRQTFWAVRLPLQKSGEESAVIRDVALVHGIYCFDRALDFCLCQHVAEQRIYFSF